HYPLFVALEGPVLLFAGGEHVKRIAHGLETIDELRPGMSLDVMYYGSRMDEWVGRWVIAFDTDMIGPFGYTVDISRTFHCGPGRPSGEQRDLYKRAYEEVMHNMTLIRAGVNFRDLTEKAFRQPEQFLGNR